MRYEETALSGRELNVAEERRPHTVEPVDTLAPDEARAILARPTSPSTQLPMEPVETREPRSESDIPPTSLHQAKAVRAAEHAVNERAAVQPDPELVKESQIASSDDEVAQGQHLQSNPHFVP